MFDQLLDDMRSHSSEWLEARHREVLGEMRQLRSEELAIVRVLDERGRIDVSVGVAGESARVVRDKVETARRLESLPAIADAACAGRFSDEQLTAVSQLADETDDAEWALRAANMSPADLTRRARTKHAPTLEESRARHQARSLRMWHDGRRAGMLQLRGELPDVLGATFQAVVERITDRMRPPKGHAWESLDRRQADALLELCGAWESAEGPSLSKPLLVAEIGPDGPAEIAGIPLPAAMVEQLRGFASVEPVLVGADDAPVTVGKRTTSLSAKIARAVTLRDGHCRCRPGCELRYGLQVHHLRPRSWGGTDEMTNLVAVAACHHPDLVPHGPYALVGNPNRIDGLQRIHVDDLAAEQAEQLGLPPPRAGP